VARLPAGDPAPADGALPSEALAGVGTRPFGFYVHVPFCASRCGYCDFNTYVPGERGAEQAGGYVGDVLAEIDLAAQVLAASLPRVDTVFFGGGTPTLLSADELIRILRRIDERFGLEPGAEITTEANPESVDPRKLEALREAGFTRLSLGMQSAVPRVLATLERVHSPGRPQQAVAEARAAGFEQVSLDLIYGTPGETADDWRASLDAALSTEPDHLSTYSLIVEPGTRMAAQVRRGELVVPGEEVIVDRFETAERVLAEAGMAWYETCSWATDEAAWCRHNLGYWGGGDWWGAGPGAHSHVGGVRWWNVLHPARWAERVAAGRSPAAGREILTPEQRRTERTMLELRLVEGLPVAGADAPAATALAGEGLLDSGALAAGVARLTLDGRLLADHVARTLLG